MAPHALQGTPPQAKSSPCSLAVLLLHPIPPQPPTQEPERSLQHTHELCFLFPWSYPSNSFLSLRKNSELPLLAHMVWLLPFCLPLPTATSWTLFQSYDTLLQTCQDHSCTSLCLLTLAHNSFSHMLTWPHSSLASLHSKPLYPALFRVICLFPGIQALCK